MSVTWHTRDLAEILGALVAEASDELIVVSPYITQLGADVVKRSLNPGVGVTVVTDIRPIDVLSGATSLKALRSLQQLPMARLLARPALHAKVFVSDWRRIAVGSANLTGRGLGIPAPGNLEVLGVMGEVTSDLAEILRGILDEGVPITAQALQQVESQISLESLQSVAGSEDGGWVSVFEGHQVRDEAAPLMWQHFPFCASPTDLVRKEGAVGSIRHDEVLCGLVGIQTEDARWNALRRNVRSLRSMRAVDTFLSEPRRFGEVTRWLHGKLEDRPVPYRSEVKELVRRVFDWLVLLYPDQYSVTSPRHTQIIARVRGKAG